MNLAVMSNCAAQNLLHWQCVGTSRGYLIVEARRLSVPWARWHTRYSSKEGLGRWGKSKFIAVFVFKMIVRHCHLYTLWLHLCVVYLNLPISCRSKYWRESKSTRSTISLSRIHDVLMHCLSLVWQSCNSVSTMLRMLCLRHLRGDGCRHISGQGQGNN